MVNLLEDTNEAVCRAVKNGEADLQITQMPFLGEGLSVEPFYEEHTLLLDPREVLSCSLSRAGGRSIAPFFRDG